MRGLWNRAALYEGTARTTIKPTLLVNSVWRGEGENEWLWSFLSALKPETSNIGFEYKTQLSLTRFLGTACTVLMNRKKTTNRKTSTRRICVTANWLMDIRQFCLLRTKFGCRKSGRFSGPNRSAWPFRKWFMMFNPYLAVCQTFNGGVDDTGYRLWADSDIRQTSSLLKELRFINGYVKKWVKVKKYRDNRIKKASLKACKFLRGPSAVESKFRNRHVYTTVLRPLK